MSLSDSIMELVGKGGFRMRRIGAVIRILGRPHTVEIIPGDNPSEEECLLLVGRLTMTEAEALFNTILHLPQLADAPARAITTNVGTKGRRAGGPGTGRTSGHSTRKGEAR